MTDIINVLDVTGTGKVTQQNPCLEHNVSGEHYYCTSGSYHGDNVSQYHK